MSFASARRKANLSQADVAKKDHVVQSTVCLWETGKTKPRASILPVIAALYGVTVDALLADDDTKEVPETGQ